MKYEQKSAVLSIMYFKNTSRPPIYVILINKEFEITTNKILNDKQNIHLWSPGQPKNSKVKYVYHYLLYILAVL